MTVTQDFDGTCYVDGQPSIGELRGTYCDGETDHKMVTNVGLVVLHCTHPSHATKIAVEWWDEWWEETHPTKEMTGLRAILADLPDSYHGIVRP